MNGVPCHYHDGRTSRRRDAVLLLDARGGLIVLCEDPEERIACEDVRIPARVVDTPRCIHLPDGGVCEVRHNDALDAEQARVRRDPEPRGERFGRLRHRLDSTWRGAAAALAVTAAILHAFTEWGAPAVAGVAVAATPPEVEAVIGNNILGLLDRLELLEPSGLEPNRRNELLAVFEEMSREVGIGNTDLRFHSVGIPNAFALPGGTVIVTDMLVELAEDDEEIIAVLAHELGHVAGRHAMRQLAQTSSMLVLWTAFTGDVSVAALSFLGPDRLLTQRYSRAFERDADRFAFDYLLGAEIPPTRLADIVQRLSGGRDAGGSGGPLDWLSSHPGAAERAQSAEDAAERARAAGDG